jgi:hypothetical protein
LRTERNALRHIGQCRATGKIYGQPLWQLSAQCAALTVATKKRRPLGAAFALELTDAGVSAR